MFFSLDPCVSFSVCILCCKDCGFTLKSGIMMLLAFSPKVALTIVDLLWFHMSYKLCFISSKNVLHVLIRIILNL